MKQTILLPFGCALVLDIDAKDAQATIERVQKRVGDRRKLMRLMANAMRKDIRRQFAEGGDPAWKPLAPSTIAQKNDAGLPALTAKGNIPRRLKQNGQFSAANILIATGRLRDSWGRADHPDHVETVDARTGEIDMGSKVPYAAVHQFGGEKAYPIPKVAGTGKRLSFLNGDGKRVVVRSVMHPPLAKRSVNMTKKGADAMAEAFLQYVKGDDDFQAELLRPD